jgi:acyl-CoA-binding protein
MVHKGCIDRFSQLGPVDAAARRCPTKRRLTVSKLKAQFEQAVADSKTLSERPDNMTMLKLYALYKQASSGDVDGKRPGFADMIGRAKFDAWAGLKGTSNDAAMTQYIALVEELKG